MNSVPELDSEMQALIVQELDLNGVHLDKYPWLSSDCVIREICRAIVPEPHEGRIAPFGVIFAASAAELASVERVAVPIEQLSLARRLADGRNCFVLFEMDRFSGLVYFKDPLVTELQLVQCLPASGGMVVQRSSTGVTKFFQGDSISLHENRVWLTKPPVEEATWKISQCVSGINRAVLNRILEFSFHLLSPTSRVGAIFVWCFCEPYDQILKELTEGQDLTSFDLSILNEAHAATICHLLSQVDGATFLDPQGKLIRTSVHLKYSDVSRDLLAEHKGTRHTSAQRFSFDIASSLVITISEDGPVTVFSDGASIANLRIRSSYDEVRLLKAAIPKKTGGYSQPVC